MSAFGLQVALGDCSHPCSLDECEDRSSSSSSSSSAPLTNLEESTPGGGLRALLATILAIGLRALCTESWVRFLVTRASRERAGGVGLVTAAREGVRAAGLGRVARSLPFRAAVLTACSPAAASSSLSSASSLSSVPFSEPLRADVDA